MAARHDEASHRGGSGAPDDGPGQDSLRDLDWLAGLMDDRFQVPGTRIRFGLDVLVGLVPVVGDTATTMVSGYLFWRAARLGLPFWLLVAMAGNIALDFLLGLVPFVGDLLDIGFRANRRNLALVRRHLARREGRAAGRPRQAPRPGAGWYRGPAGAGAGAGGPRAAG
ncbi:MAG: DUF4112 domain-containing protein [Sneathiellaceae bacterium]